MFQAKYPGRCAECEEKFDTGDMIEQYEGLYQHVLCPSPATTSAGPTCPACWTELPVTGVCGVCD